ncbi:calcium-activated chloride channel regulator 2-like [Ornithodoros turicata]|uniref:calcium-activated chloride channel regulator 2-like n=1 Tax=Ornithodoros turicata TaxID=34597 RepID=UPI0031393774
MQWIPACEPRLPVQCNMAPQHSFPGVFLLALCVCFVHCDISLVKNGYKGIVVALSPSVQVEDAQAVFTSLQNVFSSASRAVFDKLEKRAFFEEITLLLPKGSKFEEQLNLSDVSYTISSRPSYDSAHFVIETQGVFGQNPYTLQFGPCGTQGLRAIVPLPLLNANNGDVLAEEWIRYRYGVFSTEQFPGDPLYSQGVPSKQDVLCGSSVRDVIFRSEDFKDINLAGESQWKQPAFKIVKEAPLRFVVAWDVVDVNKVDTPEVKNTRYAVQKFVSVMVPNDASGAMIYFGDTKVDGQDSLRPMDTGGRDFFVAYFPASSTGPSYLPDALSKAKSMLEEQGKSTVPATGGTILVITERNISDEVYPKAKEALQNTDITLHALLLPKYGGDDTLERLTTEFGGKTVYVPVMGEALSLATQADSIASIVLQGTDSSHTVVLQNEIKNGLQAGEDWELPIELDLKRATTLTVEITKKSMDSRFNNLVQLSSPNNETTYSSRSQEFKFSNDFFRRWFDIPDPSPGTWTLKLQSSAQVYDDPLMITAKAKTSDHGEAIGVNVWTSETSDIVNSSQPLIIYAEVRKGAAPIRGAVVEATVRTPGGDAKFELVDNGRGDPDVTEGDGIYTRYFTAFSTRGHYTLSVFVKGTDLTQLVPTRPDGDGLQCCGSEFPKEPAEKTGAFRRYSQYGSFVTLKDRPEGDIFPPSRVTDLVVKHIDSGNMRVTLQWTAPGNDLDSGRADAYEIRYFDREVQFNEEFETAGKLIGKFDVDGLTDPPKEYGQLETATVFNLKCKRKPDSCYFALRAKDKLNYGSVSNIVSAQFDAIPTTTGVDGGGVVTPDPSAIDGVYVENRRGGSYLGLVIGIPVALIILIIILVVIGIWFVTRRKRRDKEPPARQRYPVPQQNGKSNDAGPTDQNKNEYEDPSMLSTSISPVNSYSAEYLLERYEEEKKRKSNKAATAPDKEDLPASSDESSVGKANTHPIWWMPKGPQAPDESDQPAAVYATVDKPKKDISPRRMQTFV